MKPDNIIFIGVFITVVGALTTGYGTFAKSKAARAESDSLKLKIAKLETQNEAQSEDLKGFATGGDSYLQINIVTLGNDLFKLLVGVQGKYPLSEVEMWYIDMNGWNKMSNAEAAKYQEEWRNKTFTKLGYFRQGGLRELGIFKFEKDKGVYLEFHFFANNGTPMEIIRGKWVDGQWRFATLILRGLNDEPIYNIDPKYPSRADKDATINDFY
jgi:hypothetical protein